MMPYRSTLFLVTCVAFLGGVPESARSYPMQSNLSAIRNVLLDSAQGTLKIAQAAPAPASSPTATPTPEAVTTLKPGDQGPDVTKLQTMLKQLGYYDGSVDGLYSPTTETAVSKFQQALGLEADGVAGAVTLDALQEAQATRAKTSPAPGSSFTEAAINASAQDAQSPEAKVASNSRTAPGPSRSWLGWLLGVVAIATVGAGCLYLLKRFQNASDQPESSALPDQPISAPELGGDAASPIDLAVASHRAAEKNGHSLPATISEPPTSEGDRASEALALEETTRLPKINIVNELIKELRSPDPAKRRKAIWELGQRGDGQAVQPLVDLMLTSDSKQRSLILAALSEIGTKTLKPMNRALAISLQDENPEVRKNAIRDLTRIYDLIGQISQLLRHAVDDPDPEVQETARWALGQVDRIRSVSKMDNSLPPVDGSLPALKNSTTPPES